MANYWSRLKLKSILAAVFFSSGTGLLFSFLGFPIPWLLGAFVATVFYCTVSGNRDFWPTGLREAGLLVIGYSLGRQVTAETALQILMMLPLMLLVTILMISFSCFVGYVTSRRTGISAASGILGSVPGGAMQMIIMAEDYKDIDQTVVILMQIARIMSTLMIVPFIALYGLSCAGLSAGPAAPATAFPIDWAIFLPGLVAAFIGAKIFRFLKAPLPYFLGAVFGAAVLTISGYETWSMPRELLNAAQLVFGIYMGVGINLEGFRRLGKISAYALGGALAMVAFNSFLAYGLTIVTPASLVTTFLGTSPGGIAEMSMTAMVLHADVVTVMSYQIFRLVFIVLVLPPFLRWRLNKPPVSEA